MTPRRTGTLVCTALTLSLVGSACGDTSGDTSDDKGGGAAGATTTAAVAPAGEAKTLKVTGVDYAFTGVPASVVAGTVVSFTNSSPKEVHELVALRVKDGETRPVSALLQLPEAERDAAAEFRGVAIAYPGEPGFSPQGPLTLSQPGRYLFVCTIPTGADPAAYKAAAAAAKGPIEVPGGPPHVVQGMVTELMVT